MSESDFMFVRDAVVQIANHGWKLLPMYTLNGLTGNYQHREFDASRELESIADLVLTQKVQHEFHPQLESRIKPSQSLITEVIHEYGSFMSRESFRRPSFLFASEAELPHAELVSASTDLRRSTMMKDSLVQQAVVDRNVYLPVASKVYDNAATMAERHARAILSDDCNGNYMRGCEQPVDVAEFYKCFYSMPSDALARLRSGGKGADKPSRHVAEQRKGSTVGIVTQRIPSLE